MKIEVLLLLMPYAALLAWLLYRHTERSLALLAHASAAAHQRHMACVLKRAWQAGNKKAAARSRERRDHYPVHACVFGRRQGVEL